MDLSTEIQFLQGVGPKRAELLQKEMDLFTVEDLLYLIPYKYLDKSKIYQISELNSTISVAIQLKGRISNIQTIGQGRARRLSAKFTDTTGSIELVWFKGIQWVQKTLKPNSEYIIFGKPTLFNGKFNITHPEIESSIEANKSTGLEPQYSIPEKLKSKFISSKVILKLIKKILAKNIFIPETLPASIIKENKLLRLKDCIYNIHFPKNQEILKQAEYRIKFEELFYIQLKLLMQKQYKKDKFKGAVFSTIGNNFNTFFKKHLSFELTNAQKRVIKEIRADFASGKQMNRLLQGDVGSGKTLVALFSMLIAVDNNFQTALMAPTEILATQHFNTISKQLKNLPIKIHLLTGSTKKAERKIIDQDLRSGECQILIGTHALIEDTVVFENLALVIIDEQHRFGVAQRAKLWKKGKLIPHILVMTATPIPRTLSMTLYGDLDISVIDELPPGRKAIKTIHMYDGQQERLIKFMREQITLGRQIYVVYPLIKESEKLDFKALEEGFWTLNDAFPAPQYAISIVHGQKTAKEKEWEMQRFVKKQTQIMVATTVIEVGVDVPNATVMVIESAERFGLSQLHQLRGRVGRGAEQSFCILRTSYKLGKESKERINAMVSSNDGFYLSEIDMKLRGPGSIEGTQQSGIPFQLRLANLITDQLILQQARQVAENILSSDPYLTLNEHSVLLRNIKKNAIF